MANCIILSGGIYTTPDMAKIQRSLGPYRLSSTLEDNGYTTFVLDFINNFSLEEVKQVLSKHLHDTLWVGFSSTFFWPKTDKDSTFIDRMYYTSHNEILELIQYIKQNSNAKLIYGGARAPYFMGNDKEIDYYVSGYADNSIINITDNIKNGVEMEQHIDSSKYELPAMDNLKTYWWNKHYNVLPGEGLPIELARGCIFKCKFCSYPLLGKKKGTYLRDVEEIKDELIKTWEQTGTTNYYITDDTFNDDNDKIDALHKMFTSLPFKPKFSAYLRVDLINKYPHQADIFTDMGLIGTYFGLETMQPDSAKSIGKGLHPNKVKDRLYWLRDKWKNKVNIGAGFILGLPYDTEEYFNELLEWSLEEDNPIQQIQFYPLYLFNYPKGHRLVDYISEFSLNPEIYGYEFDGNPIDWELKCQDLSYKKCGMIANEFNKKRGPLNHFSEFQMITYLNMGVDLNDLYNLNTNRIIKKYNMELLNQQKINEYKSLLLS
jgi:hypothetical protein